MPLAQDDHVVQTLVPNGSDQSLCIRILPEAGRTTDDLADAHAWCPRQISPIDRRITNSAVSIRDPAVPGTTKSIARTGDLVLAKRLCADARCNRATLKQLLNER
jgi:hypothetical protein